MTTGGGASGRGRWAAVFGLGAAAAVSCGRTGLELDESQPLEGSPVSAGPTATATATGTHTVEAGPPTVMDAAADAATDAATDATPDAKLDAAIDAPLDAFKDVATDPPAEADAGSVKTDCTDPTSRWIYVLTDLGVLHGYDPPTGVYHLVGTLNCPTSTTSSPFSMAVSRPGTAFVVFHDGALYRVSTKTAECSGTTYLAGQQGFTKFGMGFATIDKGPEERLYVARTPLTFTEVGLSALGIIDTTTLTLQVVGSFQPSLLLAELTGTGDGRLFGFSMDKTDPDRSRIVQIDKNTAAILTDDPVPGVAIGHGWAFAFWGGSFYMFTSPGEAPGVPVLDRYDPTTHATTRIDPPPGRVVGAGVSTCAPE